MLPDEPIYRVEHELEYKGVWRIYGLNLLGWAEVPDTDYLLPFKETLRCLLNTDHAPAVLIGGYTFAGASWREVIGDQYVEVDATIYCGDLFSSSEAGTVRPGVFAPRISRDTVLSTLMDGCFAGDNAIMVMSEVEEPLALAEVLRNFTTEKDVLVRLRKLAGWVIVPGHDGDYLEIWSERLDANERIAECAAAADNAVKQLPWFVETQNRLHWDDLAMCYRDCES